MRCELDRERAMSPRALRPRVRKWRADRRVSAAGDPGEVFPLRWTLPLPGGLSEDYLRSFLDSVSVEGSPPDELRHYCRQDFRRFVYTLGLVSERSGRCLELGANPYFTTMLLRELTELELTLANYFGPGHPDPVVETVTYAERGSGARRRVEFVSSHFNVEEDEFPFADGQFDLVLFCETIEHLLRDPLHALKEIARVLRTDGALVLTTPNVGRLENVTRLLAGLNVHDQYSGHGPYGRHNREFTRQELELLLRHAGFEVESLVSADVYPNRAAEFADWRPLVPTLLRRERDLGQYLFSRARRTGLGAAKRPDSLFRSFPPDEIESVNPHRLRDAGRWRRSR
jgi:SAM-dependent methyltransferase